MNLTKKNNFEIMNFITKTEQLLTHYSWFYSKYYNILSFVVYFAITATFFPDITFVQIKKNEIKLVCTQYMYIETDSISCLKDTLKSITCTSLTIKVK